MLFEARGTPGGGGTLTIGRNVFFDGADTGAWDSGCAVGAFPTRQPYKNIERNMINVKPLHRFTDIIEVPPGS